MRRFYFNGRTTFTIMPYHSTFDSLRILIPFSFTYWYFMYKMRVYDITHTKFHRFLTFTQIHKCICIFHSINFQTVWQTKRKHQMKENWIFFIRFECKIELNLHYSIVLFGLSKAVNCSELCRKFLLWFCLVTTCVFDTSVIIWALIQCWQHYCLSVGLETKAHAYTLAYTHIYLYKFINGACGIFDKRMGEWREQRSGKTQR